MSYNRLGEETSPYLRQHKDNPVHWLPWGDEALRLAREQDRPILLSSGYAACHWCHVMAHESFEDPDIATIMNTHFICVKVDREERPDVDHYYMQALRMMGEQGGWPLTMFLTPDGTPFWGGTYFPPEPRYGRPGFAQVLREIARLWREDRGRLFSNAAALGRSLREQATRIATTPMPSDLPTRVADALVELFDPERGGIGGAPKFPQLPALELILSAGGATARHHVVNTLVHIAQGGIHDHLGGGIARYSTDELWLVPHFEKMLYDNAQFVSICARAWAMTGKELFRLRIEETVAFLQRELHVPGAGFASSLDADSEGEEGRFYVWSHEEVRRIVAPEHFELFRKVYDVSHRGNWEGRVILNRLRHLDPLSDEEERILAEQRARLFEAREKRVRPGRDDKVLASWNGLAISALSLAGLMLGRDDWIEFAAQAFGEARAVLGNERGGLWQSFNERPLKVPATADGLANMIAAAIDLHVATSRRDHLEQALSWLAHMDAHYLTASDDAYHFTHDAVGDMPLRQIFSEDEATPNHNGVMVGNLARLAHLTGEENLRARAERILMRFARPITENPLAHAAMLEGAHLLHHGAFALLAHDPESVDDSRETTLMRALARAMAAMPTIAHASRNGDAEKLAEYQRAALRTDAPRPFMIVCRDQGCSLPLRGKEEVRNIFS